MNPEHPDPVERLIQWVEAIGFRGELSSLAAGLHDIPEAVNQIQDVFLPGLLDLEAVPSDEALDLLVGLRIELEHIQSHCECAADTLRLIENYVGGSLE